MRACQNWFCSPKPDDGKRPRGVRKLVTRKYRYIIYYLIDQDAEEIVILNVKHPAQKREQQDI
jgi:toxin ParE1/3/4